jgi:hypothetical protein
MAYEITDISELKKVFSIFTTFVYIKCYFFIDALKGPDSTEFGPVTLLTPGHLSNTSKSI